MCGLLIQHCCGAAGARLPALARTLCSAAAPAQGTPLRASLEESYPLVASCLAPLRAAGRHPASWQWYLATQARLQVNLFRCQLPLPLSTLALAPDAMAQGSSGAAVYAFASLLNHSCAPNVDVLWRRGCADVACVARQAVRRGQQLTATYIDASAGVAQRRALLRHGWGFECTCALCVSDCEE